ncbi:MAG TPA: potassium channel family protein, partial [Bacteroidales bacterium]|nr:potassium channel family protein [Bacteroidales bacterium]
MKRFSGLRNIELAILILITITLIGIAGYCFIENYSLLDAIYMTAITIATVGYEEVHPLSENGKIFTIFLIVFSWGTFAYAVSVVTSHFISLNLRDTFHRLKTISRIKKMKNHIIICGYGRNGQQTVNELLAYHQDFVVIEQNKVLVDENKEKINIIQGDSTTDETLIEAGVQHARALITALPIDADNLFVALTVRALNPDILIVSRATFESSEKKLHIAGVNHVIFPEKVGGSQMAVLVSHPDVVEFLNHLSIHGSS